MVKMTVKEKQDICANAIIKWAVQEQLLNTMPDKEFIKFIPGISEHDEEIENLFTSKMILKKFEVFNIDIILPDMLLLILYICTEGNPGMFQVILKDLLNNIKKEIGPIPPEYIIRIDDAAKYFNGNFPILDIPEVQDKYCDLWQEQKGERKDNLSSDNLCDTPEWWKEVMQ
jgi:hypothetical protein